MAPSALQRIFGMLLMISGLTMVPAALVGLLYDDASGVVFVASGSALLAAGAALFLPVRDERTDLRTRDGFMIVVLAWFTLGSAGALPLMLSEIPAIPLTDALFESFSGLTTTGATVLTGLDDLPRGLLFYRQEQQWLGGMGIIVLAVAILPILRVGGMQLYRAETPGPMKDAKLTPRIAETAKALWYLYLALTIACATAYWIAGMTLFDAVSHAFSTIAIGGFSTHDLSFAYFDNPTIEAIAVVFMMLAGINFALHFQAWRSASMQPYRADAEWRAYITILLAAAVVVSAGLYLGSTTETLWPAIRHGVFQAVSIATTTGFTTAPWYAWPAALTLLLILLSSVGACAGSTGGGVKVIRVVLLWKQGFREIRRLVHPNAVVPIKLNKRRMPEQVIQAVWGFFCLYIVCFCLMSLALAATGLDLITALSAVASCINNLGPALGEAGPNYASLPATAKYVLILAMLLGRLEIFTLLVLLSPVFWRS